MIATTDPISQPGIEKGNENLGLEGGSCF